MKPLLRLLALLAAAASFAQTAWWEPAAPRIGDVVTIYYDANAGTLSPTANVWLHWGVLDQGTGSWSTPPAEIWPEGSLLHTDNVALQSPMANDGAGVSSVTIDFDDETEAIAFVFTDRQNNWDNNGGNNWEIIFLAPGTVSWWTPEEPEPGDVITIYYDAVPGTLPNGVTNVILHWGVNEVGHGNWTLPPEEIWPDGTVAQGQAVRTPMTGLGNGLFQVIIDTNDEIFSLHYVTTDGTNWDNNGNENWDIFLDEPPPVVSSHVIFRFDPRSAFSQFAGTVNTVNLAGTFNGWSTTANPLSSLDPYGNRFGDVAIPVGDLEYKFVINSNNWLIDPDNPRNAAGGFNNSLLTVEIDSLPQFFATDPGENIVSLAGSDVVLTFHVRAGDLGPGLDPDPVSAVDGQPLGSTWDEETSLLILAPLPSGEGIRNVRLTAIDSAGHANARYFAYGFRGDEGYLAVDPYYDIAYGDDGSLDLNSFRAIEIEEGDSIEFEFTLNALDPMQSMILMTISAETGSYGPIEGLSAEYHVPGMSSGGISLLMIDQTNPYYAPELHNVIHPGGSLTAPGQNAAVSFDFDNFVVTAHVSTNDLEASLGSYQSAWYYTAATLIPDGEDDGYCGEPTAEIGGIDGEEEPDVYDAMFFMARDVERKMFHNYGLTRRVTMDAPGRGVAAITPEEIGPNIRTPGPVCRVLTRGASTTNPDQSVVGQVESPIALTSVWLTHDEAVIPVTLNADTFLVDVTLTEGLNTFNVWAVDVNQDTGRSASMVFDYVVDHTPQISVEARLEGVNGFLDASGTFDPFGFNLHYFWSPDPDNPEVVQLGNWQTPVADMLLPQTPGEYYFDLHVFNDDEYESFARTFIRVDDEGDASPFENDQTAAWVQNAIMYEIFVRSYSASGDLDGVTADIPRLADMGVSVIWLMPIFEGPSDHGYEITDYYTVEQDYGTDEDLHELVEACHTSGIRLILDMVINHTGIGHPHMQDAIRYGHYSHYWDWYDRDANGDYTHYFDWTSLPNINYENPECAQYFIDMCKYWVSEFDIDGYRCDVAWGPHQRTPQFWVNWRQQLKEVKPELMLFAEAAANDFTILTDRFDLAKDWNLHHEGQSAFTNLFPAIPNFDNLTDLITNFGFPWADYKGPVRFMENHDEARYITLKTPQQTKMIASLLLSIPGVPQIYAGQEIGFTSQRGQIIWNQDPEGMAPLYYRLIKGRSLLPVMRTGDFTLIPNSQNGACYSYARTLDGEFPVAFLGNFSSTSQLVSVTIDPDLFDIHPDSTYVVTDLVAGTNITRAGSELGSLFTSLSPYQSRLWVIADSALVLVDADPSAQPAVPDRLSLLPAYPNPFNPSTTIPLEIDRARHVRLSVYDVLGREVATLVDGILEAGHHSIQWDGRSNLSLAGSGIYFAVMTSESDQQVRKLVLLK